MQILVNPDERICCDNEVVERIQGVLQGALERFALQLAQVTVSLRDLDSPQSGERDKICTLEARIPGTAPIAVSHDARTLTEAIHGAADKLEHALHRWVRGMVRADAASGKQPMALSPADGLSVTAAIVDVDR